VGGHPACGRKKLSGAAKNSFEKKCSKETVGSVPSNPAMTLPVANLSRFLDAQAPVYAAVCAELGSGRKTSHWMWFIFPQLKALGRSSTAQFYGIESKDEALAYWQHPVLGPRLKHCAQLVLNTRGKTAREIFGAPDDLKLRSCMTLFSVVAGDEPVFAQVLGRFFEGEPDVKTLALLGG
jgi:uncharacterized protein (DUF1810 family)